MNLKKIILFLGFAFLCLAPVSFSRHAMATDLLKTSSAEDVALTFYKIANIKPDFKEWAKNTDDFKYKSVTETQYYIGKESLRLNNKWEKIQKNGDMINIHMSINARLEEAEKSLETDKEKYNVRLLLKNPAHIYFPYTFQNNNYAVIPEDLETLLLHTVDEVQNEMVLKTFSIDLAQPVEVDISVKPIKAYTNAPQKIDKTDQWILMGKVISMAVSSPKTQTVLWYYGAPWYVSPKATELEEIYNIKRKNIKDSMNTSP